MLRVCFFSPFFVCYYAQFPFQVSWCPFSHQWRGRSCLLTAVKVWKDHKEERMDGLEDSVWLWDFRNHSSAPCFTFLLALTLSSSGVIPPSWCYMHLFSWLPLQSAQMQLQWTSGTEQSRTRRKKRSQDTSLRVKQNRIGTLEQRGGFPDLGTAGNMRLRVTSSIIQWKQIPPHLHLSALRPGPKSL